MELILPSPPIPDRGDGGNLFRVQPQIRQLFPQLHDALIESSRGSEVTVAPNLIEDAIAREKEIKRWRGEKKNELVQTLNPKWEDVRVQLFGDTE